MKKQYQQQQKLVLLFANDFNYSVVELKQRIKTTRDLELFKALFALLTTGIKSIDVYKSKKDCRYLLDCCRYISEILSMNIALNPHTVRQYLYYTKKCLNKKLFCLKDNKYDFYEYLSGIKEIIQDMETLYINDRLTELYIRCKELERDQTNSQNDDQKPKIKRKRKEIRRSRNQLIEEYGYICMLGDDLSNSIITFHHIEALRNKGGNSPENGALLSWYMHNIFNKFERYCPELAEEITWYLLYYKETRDEEMRSYMKEKVLDAYYTMAAYN